MLTTKRYGWVRDHPDHRDIKYKIPRGRRRANLPMRIDLRPQCPAIYDQNDLGSCTAQAIGAACQFADMKFGADLVVQPSRLFVYYNTRYLEGTIRYDAGAQIRDGMKAINRWGYPAESVWPYVIKDFAKKPSQTAYKAAKADLISQYSSVAQTANALKACLADGFPVVFGFAVYESFEAQTVIKTGIVSMPGKADTVVGGHAVLLVGYDDAKKWWIVRNSWGEGWGDAGHCYFPYAYLLHPDLADDFWTVRYAA